MLHLKYFTGFWIHLRLIVHFFYLAEPVFITEHPRSVQLQCGQDLVLRCEATGFPRPRYQWFKDRIQLPDQLANEISLKKVSPEDSGVYYCVVTNPVGSEYTNYAEVQVVPMIAPIG